VIWNRALPDIHRLPVPLLDFELSLMEEDEEIAKLLMENEKETSFGVTVRQAWEVTNKRRRKLGELMLFCWASKQGSVNTRNGIAHPKPTIAEAKERILADFTAYGHLGDFAVGLVDRHPRSFRNSL
jgi:hypothetical protein